MSESEEEYTGKIRALPLWQGPVSMNRLPGGITNRNYRVSDASGSYVARLGEELPLLGVDRRNELACHRAAEELGVAPGVVHGGKGVLVSHYIESRTLTPDETRQPDFFPRLAQVLRRLHDGWDGLTGEFLYFTPFMANRSYAATSRRIGAILPETIDEFLQDDRTASRQIAPFIPTLCHNDMLPANVLDDGNRVWIVDWEYAGIGHPLFDLAGISANCSFSAELDRDFLASYRGWIEPRDLLELRILKTSSLLREALWSIVQTVASDLDFDYRAYADASLVRYQLARSERDATEEFVRQGVGRTASI